MIDEELISRFYDEEPQVFIAAAEKIGRRASEAEYAKFLLQCLENAAGEHVHGHRHAWVSLGSVLRHHPDFVTLSAVDVEEASVSDWLCVARRELSRLVLHGILSKEEDPSLAQLIGKVEWVAEHRKARVETLERELSRLSSQSKMERAVGAKEAELRRWENLETKCSDLWKRDSLGKPPLKDGMEWCWAGFFAGVRLDELSAMGLCPDTAVRSLIEIGALKAGVYRGLLMNLPRLLANSLQGEFADQVPELVGALKACNFSPKSSVTDWIDFQFSIQSIPEGEGGRRDPLQAVLCVIADHPEFARAERDRLREQLDEGRLCKHLQKRLLYASKQALVAGDAREGAENEYLFHSSVMAAVLIAGDGIPVQERMEQLVELLGCLKGPAHDSLFTASTRLLKRLAFQDAAGASSPESAIDVADHHLSIIHPLVMRWNLRNTVPKDLATIAVRSLAVVWKYTVLAEGDAGDNRSNDAEGLFWSCLYKFLYALPEGAILSHMYQYAPDKGLRNLLRGIHEVLACDCVESASRYAVEVHRRVWATAGEKRQDTSSSLLNYFASSRDQVFDLEAEQKSMLVNIFSIRHRWLRSMEDGFRRSGSDEYHRECEFATRVDARQDMQEFNLLVHRVAAMEQKLTDSGTKPEDALEALRSLVEKLGELVAFSRKSLPLLERTVFTYDLEERADRYEQQIDLLSRVVEREAEGLAIEIADAGSCAPPYLQAICTRWMLDRMMLKELAGLTDNPLLQRMTSPFWVLALIGTPFVVSGILHLLLPPEVPDIYWAWPFLAACGYGLVEIILFWRRKHELPAGMSKASLLLPQMLASLFLGVLGEFSADESWAAGVLGNPVVWGSTSLVFIFASYFFVRHVLLKRQFVDRPEEWAGLRARAWSVLSLGIAQAFVIILLFSLMKGSVMSLPSRADLIAQLADPNLGTELSTAMSRILPGIAVLGSPGGWFGCFYLYPYAILSWVPELYFFGAIFERIMNGRKG